MSEPLTNEKKKFISITPKNEELIVVNTGNEVKEVLSWALPFFTPNDIESALDGLQDDMVERGHEEFRAIEMIGMIRKWFPVFNQE